MEFVIGSRMMGGGFGGCTINLVKKSNLAEFKEKISKEYKNHTALDIEIYSVNIDDGARVINYNYAI